jgi:hypothetical protein
MLKALRIFKLAAEIEAADESINLSQSNAPISQSNSKFAVGCRSEKPLSFDSRSIRRR